MHWFIPSGRLESVLRGEVFGRIGMRHLPGDEFSLVGRQFIELCRHRVEEPELARGDLERTRGVAGAQQIEGAAGRGDARLVIIRRGYDRAGDRKRSEE